MEQSKIIDTLETYHTLMYYVKIEIFLEHQKYETIVWLVIGVVHDLNILCGEDGA